MKHPIRVKGFSTFLSSSIGRCCGDVIPPHQGWHSSLSASAIYAFRFPQIFIFQLAVISRLNCPALPFNRFATKQLRAFEYTKKKKGSLHFTTLFCFDKTSRSFTIQKLIEMNACWRSRKTNPTIETSTNEWDAGYHKCL